MHDVHTERRESMTTKELEQYQSLKEEQADIETLLWETETADDYKRLKNLYQSKLSEIIDARIRIENAINTLEPTERRLMRLHYVFGLTWEEVGRRMYYERSQVYRIRRSALKKLKNA